jgi:hypothetical protein
MDDCDYMREQARECRTAALRAQNRPERQGLMQLARYYEAEAGRKGSDMGRGHTGAVHGGARH